MRIKLKYVSKEDKGFLLPMHYNSVIQGLIYNTFSKEISNFLHGSGYLYEKRSFKLFTFSRILNKGEKVYGKRLSDIKKSINLQENTKFFSKRNSPIEEALYFKNGIEFYFSSPKNNLVEDMASKAVLNPETNFIGQSAFVASIEVMPYVLFSDSVNIKMLSPVTVYSTTTTKEGKLLTYYYSPYEKNFSELIRKNALKKYHLINGKNVNFPFEISPLYFSEKRNRVVAYFKNTRIEGWTGIFTLKGAPPLLKTVYDAGIGSKNSEGFGMFAIYDKKN